MNMSVSTNGVKLKVALEKEPIDTKWFAHMPCVHTAHLYLNTTSTPSDFVEAEHWSQHIYYGFQTRTSRRDHAENDHCNVPTSTDLTTMQLEQQRFVLLQWPLPGPLDGKNRDFKQWTCGIAMYLDQ
eukprot:3099153-Amphidinium_carterae.2